MIAHQEKPVAAPGHIACHRAVTGHLHGNAGAMAISRDIANADAVGGVQFESDGPHRRFKRVAAGLNAAQMSQRHCHADGAMAAHAQVACVVEEDNASGTCRIDRLNQKRPNQDVGTARLAEDGAPQVVVIVAQLFHSLSQRAGAEIGAASQHTARRLARSMRVDNLQSKWDSLIDHGQAKVSS